jgi:hypothetical protein
MGIEVMVFSLFYLDGHLRNLSLVLSLLGKRDTVVGFLKCVVYHSQSYLPLFHP